MLNIYVIRLKFKIQHFKKKLCLRNLRQRIQIWITSQFEQLPKTLHSNNFLLRAIFKCGHFQKIRFIGFEKYDEYINIDTKITVAYLWHTIKFHI